MRQPVDDIFSQTEFRVRAGAGGSFLLDAENGIYGFTNVTDLMTWLQRAAQAQQAAEVMTLGETQVVQGDKLAADRVRRTTALASLAERMDRERNWPAGVLTVEQPKGAA